MKKSIKRQEKKARMAALYEAFVQECKRCGISLAEYGLWDALVLNGRRRRVRDRIMASPQWRHRQSTQEKA